jgi:hypothetical protein
MSSDFITCFQATNISIFAMQVKHIHTFFGVRPEDHYKAFHWFLLAYNVPTKVSLPVWASHPPRSPLLCLMGSAVTASSTPSHGSAIAASPNIPVVWHRSFPAQLIGTPRLVSTAYYVRSYPYRLSWLYCFHVSSLHEPVLRFKYDNKPYPSSITLDKVVNHRHHTDQVPIMSPQIIFSTLIGSNNHNDRK